MACVRCGREIAADAVFCQHCGTDQRAGASSAGGKRFLRRSLVDQQIAGVCGGIASYFDIDPVFVRVAWVVLTIVPGAIFLGVLAYLVAWLIIPEAELGSESTTTGAAADSSQRSRRLHRSATDAKIAGVCGGIAEYFSVDPTRDPSTVGGAVDLSRRDYLRCVRLSRGVVHHAHGSSPRHDTPGAGNGPDTRIAQPRLTPETS